MNKSIIRSQITNNKIYLRLAISAIVVIATFNNDLAIAKDKNLDKDWDKVLSKGNYQLSVGNTNAAIEILQKKVREYPTSAACHTALGCAYKKIGKIDEAKAQFIVATQLEPTYAKGFYELGAMEESDKHWAQAADDFERYNQLSPSLSERQGIADRIKFDRQH